METEQKIYYVMVKLIRMEKKVRIRTVVRFYIARDLKEARALAEAFIMKWRDHYIVVEEDWGELTIKPKTTIDVTTAEVEV